MSNLFKKVTSAVAGLAVVFSIVSPIAGVNAVYSSSLEAANKLASVGVINDNSANPADYRLGDTITRREVMKVAMNLASCQNVVLNSTYAGKFSDVPASDWAWKYAETAVDNGFVAANATFAPARNVTKGESLKMVMNVTQIEKASGGANFWADYVQGGVNAGIVESFSDYDTTATRGWIFKVAANALETGSCGANTTDNGDDLLGDLLGDIDNTDTGSTDTGSTDTTVSGEGVLTVSLSADTPDSATVPAAVKGLPVAAYDFTAGSEDVTVTSITVKRSGLSDKDTITSLAAFTKDGRISKGKNDSLNNDTEAQLTLTNGLVVKAGETVTVWVVVDVNDLAPDSGTDGVADAYDEFAIGLVEITASANVETDGSLVGNTMKVGAVEAASLEIKDGGSVSNPKLGEEGVEIFKFNAVGASGTDIVLKSITFKADGDASDDLANFKLWKGTTEIASTAEMNDKYLTFNLGDGYTVAENKTDKFSVTADVVSGAGDTISFYVDKTLDVTAIDTKYGYGSNIVINADADGAGDLGPITVQAGELTLVDIEASSDKIKEDKDDVVLGKIKVTNVAGQNLELQKFGVNVALVAGGAQSGDSNNDNTINGGEVGAALTLATAFENVELYNEDTGASYELDLSGTVYQDLDIGISIPQGTTTFAIRADTLDNIANFNLATVTLSLDASLNGGKTDDASTANGSFLVKETDDDTVVSDITPSSLSWNTLDGIESSATIANVPLSNITKVRGATDVVALQFEIEADEASAITIDELKAKVWALAGTASPAAADNSEISQVTLYKGSVSEANLLDRVSGSNLATGVATFDGFDVEIAANAKQVFVVTVSFVDGANTTANDPYKVTIVSNADVSAEDEDNDDVTLASASFPVGGTAAVGATARLITVNDQGILTATTDANNDDNVDAKTILAGTTKKVFSIDVQAQNESVDVETVEFTMSTDLTKAAVNASLYLGDTLIATNSNSDISATIVKFKDLTTLIIPQETKELKLALNTATIGNEKVGVSVLNAKVTNLAFKDITGADSGKTITNITDVTVDNSSAAGITASNPTVSASANTFSIVPAVITPSAVATLSSSSSEAKIKLTVDAGSNTTDTSNNSPKATVTELKLSLPSTSAGIINTDFTVYEEGDSGNALPSANITVAAGVLTLDFTGFPGNQDVISSSKTYIISPLVAAGEQITMKLLENGVKYNVDSSGDGNDATSTTNITTQLSSELDLGTRTVSN